MSVGNDLNKLTNSKQDACPPISLEKKHVLGKVVSTVTLSENECLKFLDKYIFF